MLWMCNIGNIVLALGLFFEKPLVVRLASIWMIPGLIIWFIYVVMAWGVFLTSTLAHVGGLIVAMFALSKYGMDRITWRWAFGWSLVVQLLSHYVTSPDLNVNLAHAVGYGWERTFHSYWLFWLTINVANAIVLWLCGLLLSSLWPAGVREELDAEEL